MSHELTILLSLAFTLGFIHTLVGPDHYLPFIVIAKARKWSINKSAWITFICGLGHVLSSVFLGFIGIALGLSLTKLKLIEATRGEFAAWLMITFGFLYFVAGLRNAIKNKKHSHLHFHKDGSFHRHEHTHRLEHAHAHEKKSYKELTPLILFTIFIFGPCEVLIPMLMYPAANGSMLEVLLVALVFGITTIATMMSIVLITLKGVRNIRFKYFERYGNAIAGIIICSSGLAIKVLGL